MASVGNGQDIGPRNHCLQDPIMTEDDRNWACTTHVAEHTGGIAGLMPISGACDAMRLYVPCGVTNAKLVAGAMQHLPSLLRHRRALRPSHHVESNQPLPHCQPPLDVRSYRCDVLRPHVCVCGQLMSGSGFRFKLGPPSFGFLSPHGTCLDA